MTHKTNRELTAYENQQRAKVRPLLIEISKLTLEEAIMLQAEISRAIWFSCQEVETKKLINQNQIENVEESF